MKTQKDLPEMRSLTERVLNVYVAGFLAPTITTGHIITVFDLVEHNPDGKSRLQRLIEEKLTKELTSQEIEAAIELLEDYPSSSNLMFQPLQ
ncbi:hypothetical protein [Pedobacter gandavensis]|uniref:Uncharacterized protein n=1 Tax=Pedobacter gandavensis TaxID=2679963 RepID=A0ABR6EUI7_9SPHI|nr:hypothetical protein [Pedobacter gandavensis]MBB2148928.1 hypothetical protein [Pedobacter gandavensis]